MLTSELDVPIILFVVGVITSLVTDDQLSRLIILLVVPASILVTAVARHALKLSRESKKAKVDEQTNLTMAGHLDRQQHEHPNWSYHHRCAAGMSVVRIAEPMMIRPIVKPVNPVPESAILKVVDNTKSDVTHYYVDQDCLWKATVTAGMIDRMMISNQLQIADMEGPGQGRVWIRTYAGVVYHINDGKLHQFNNPSPVKVLNVSPQSSGYDQVIMIHENGDISTVGTIVDQSKILNLAEKNGIQVNSIYNYIITEGGKAWRSVPQQLTMVPDIPSVVPVVPAPAVPVQLA